MATLTTRNWPTINHILKTAYAALLILMCVANAYTGQHFVALMFAVLFGLDVMEVGLTKIADAIRTRRNFHVIGDGNTITIPGGSVYADNVSVKDSE
jgi:hypothetical protein